MTSCHQCEHTDEEVFLFCPRCGTRAVEGVDDSGDTLLGRTLNDKYRIDTEIGAGAMGTVYLAEHVGLKKKVALKVLHPDLQVSDESLRRFQREGIAAGKFNHPNLIQIFDFDKGAGRLFYLAMEYVEGSNLKVYLRRKGRLHPDQAMRIARQILSCLAEAHRHGIVHRDLKPDNIMIAPGPGEAVIVKVLDFGLSKLVDRRGDASLVTQQGRILGTPLYMAPEQCSGEEADSRSDLYAMGLILYEMVTGLRPFPEESTTELLFTRATKEAPSILDEFPELEIPTELDLVITKAMERRRDDRYQSGDEMMSALNAIRIDPSTWGAGSTIMTSTETLQRHRAERMARKAKENKRGALRRRWPLYLGLGVGVIVAIAIGVFFGASFLGSVPIPAKLVSMRPEGQLSVDHVLYLDNLADARSHLRDGNFEAARGEVERAMQRECADAEVHLVRGDLFKARGDWNAAGVSYRRALQEEPTYHHAYVGLGWVDYARGDYEGALDKFRTAESMASDDPPVLIGLGATSFRLHDYGNAKSFLEAACEKAPDDAVAQMYYGKLLLEVSRIEIKKDQRKQLVVKATEALVRAKVSDPDSKEITGALVSAYLTEKSFEEAERELIDAVERFGDVEFYHDLATLYLRDDRYEQARLLIVEGLQPYPDDSRLALLHGTVLASLDRGAQAIDELERGLERDPDNPSATLLLATLYHAQGMIQPAIDTYNEVRDLLGENHPEVNFELGVAYFQSEMYDEARDAFKRCVDAGTVSGLRHSSQPITEVEDYIVEAYKNLGILHMNYLGGDEAMFNFQRYQQLGGTDARVQSWLRKLGG